VSIDVNEEVRVWAGFVPRDFWIGVGVLMALASTAVLIAAKTAPFFGALFFFFTGGGFTGFMVYRQGLPKGLLWRRFLQDGEFLFLKVPGLRGVDVYRAPAQERALGFNEAFRGSHDLD